MPWLSDIEIAQSCTMRPIGEIAEKAHIDGKYLEQYGRHKAKVELSFLEESPRKEGRLVLVTAITPTPAGEGKTTTTIGLADGLRHIGKGAFCSCQSLQRVSLPDGITEIRNCHINIGTGEEISIRETADKIARETGFKGEIRWDASKPDGTLRKLTDVNRLHSLGWHHKVGIDEGISRLYKWYLKEKNEYLR